MNSKRHLLPAVAALMLAGTGFTFLRAATIAPKGYVIAEITVDGSGGLQELCRRRWPTSRTLRRKICYSRRANYRRRRRPTYW
jgi:hypothetical protein